VSSRRVRVGEFHLDLDSGELVSNDTRVRLQVQSLELLKALLERPGVMVGREELRQRLWPNDTFVDFDHGLNAAVRRLREALGDSADSPRFVETIPRKGYRLVAATDVVTAEPRTARSPVDSISPDAVGTRREHEWRPAGIAIGIVIVLAGAWLAATRMRSDTAARVDSRPPLASLTIDVPPGWIIQIWDQVAVSPDGRYIAFTAVGPDRIRSLWLHPLAGTAARQVPGSETALVPFWSLDSARVGFFANGKLQAASLFGGVQVLNVLTPTALTATWMAGGDILFTPLGATSGPPSRGIGLRRLVNATGTVQPVGSPPESRQFVDHLAPHAIPGSGAFTFLRWNTTRLELTGHIGELGTPRTFEIGRTDSRIIVTTSGHAVFVRNGTLVAQRLDVPNRRLVGASFPLAEDVAVYHPILGHFSASSDLIVYLTRTALTTTAQLKVVDREGATIRTFGDIAEYGGLRVSPDGTRVALARRDPNSGTRDIWVYDLSGRTPVRLTFDGHDDMAPAWSADGQAIMFTSDRSGERDIYRKDSAGRRPEARVFSSTHSKSLNAWSPNGRFFIYDTGARPSIDAQGRVNKGDLFSVSLEGTPQVRPLATSLAYEALADISPDGTLVAYHSSDAGSSEVFVETFPEKGGRWQVTTAGGWEPAWSANGRELFFISSREELCAVQVDRTGGTVRFGPQRVLFKLHTTAHTTVRRYAPLPDGERFVVLMSESFRSPQRMNVLVNWRSALP
jgi:Tol biopolymer transport system component/DNA-binding winged helix-turn-helix (wHTH) protein